MVEKVTWCIKIKVQKKMALYIYIVHFIIARFTIISDLMIFCQSFHSFQR